jgi:hypothetical protein
VRHRRATERRPSSAVSAPAVSGGRDQEPPDVTWPEPELADGADELLRLLELDELDLDEPELLDVALPELPELELAELELAEPEPEMTRLAAEAASVDPGRV